MKYLGHVLTLIGAGLVIFGVTGDWFLVETSSFSEAIKGTELVPGKIAGGMAGLAIALTILAIAFQRRVLVVTESITVLGIIGMLAWSFFGLMTLVPSIKATWVIKTQVGFWWVAGGAALIQMGALRVFAAGPHMSKRSRPLRVALLWNGSVIQERLFDEPHSVTVGENIKCTFTVPAGAGISRSFKLFHASSRGKYKLGLNQDMSGSLQLGGQRFEVADAIAAKGRVKGAAGSLVPLGAEDWGILHVGPLAIFFQFIEAERKVAAPFFASLDMNTIASSAFSGLMHVGIVLLCLFFWTEDEEVKRRPVVFKAWDVDAIFELEEEEEEEEDEGEEEDTTAKRAEGDEGKFGDPDIDPMIESKVPERDGKMVSKIDPKNVGLVDMLSTNKLGGMGAIANILSSDTSGLSDKMAVAMAGAGSEFVMGHGSGGMGFKGTGSGGGGLGGYGRIHGLGKIDTGGGTGMHGSLGRKRARRVGKIRVGAGRSTGFCKRGDIARVVRRRANSIRACYEQRLQVNPNLKGKVTARWTIALSGRVSSAGIASSSLGDSAVTNCIMRVIRRMSFPKPEGGVCIVQWPFVFNAGG